MINDAVRGYFGFERLPFDRSIPVGALFASASHQEAAGRIAYGIDTRQITVITGEVGAGKTVAVRAAVARLDASRYQLITIPNPQVGARGIHHAVVTALGGVPRVHHATLIPQAAGHLAAELAERGRLPVLLIDEAHLLSHDQLEAIRMLTSTQLDSASPLAVLLIGQPQLRASMRLGVLAALDQRIAVRYADGTDDPRRNRGPTCRHHTKLAGRSDTSFLRRRRRLDPPGQPRLPPGGQPARRRRPARHLHHAQDHRRHHRRPRRHHRGERPITPRALAGTLISHAAGLTSDTAAAELISAHHTWLTRADFATGYIHAGTRHDGHPYAYIDWEHAITALDNHQLSCSPSEAGILRIAASLGDHHIPVHLARVLGSLDHANIALVTTAITRANG